MNKFYTAIVTLFFLMGPSGLAQFEEEFGGAPAGQDQEEKSEIDPQKKNVTSGNYKKLKNAWKAEDEDRYLEIIYGILGKDSKNLIALNSLALHHHKKNESGLAKIILNRALEDHSEEGALKNNLGVIALSDGDMKKAMAHFKEAIKTGSNSLDAEMNLSAIYLEYKDYTRVLEPLEGAYRRVKGAIGDGGEKGKIAVQVAINYAVALNGLGDSEKAIKIYNKILDEDKRNEDALFNYVVILVEVLKKYDEAKRPLSRLKFMVEDPRLMKRIEAMERKVKE